MHRFWCSHFSMGEMRSGGFAGGAVGDFLEAAEGCVYGFGVRERIDQIGRDDDQVAAFLHTLVVLAAHCLGEVEIAGREGVASGDSIGFLIGMLFLWVCVGRRPVGPPHFSQPRCGPPVTRMVM